MKMKDVFYFNLQDTTTCHSNNVLGGAGRPSYLAHTGKETSGMIHAFFYGYKVEWLFPGA